MNDAPNHTTRPLIAAFLPLAKVLAWALWPLALLALTFLAPAYPTTPAAAQNRVTLEREGYPMAFQNGPRGVTFDQKPTKILALGLGSSELLVELGLADLLAWRTPDPSGERPLPKYAQALSAVPEIETASILQIETDRGGPDFIYGLFSPAVPDPPFVKTYHALATNKTQFFGEVLDLGKLFDVEDRAAAFLRDQESRLARLSSKLTAVDPVDVLVVWDLTDDALLTSGGPDFPTEILHLAGARNVFSDLGPSPTSPLSEVVARDPNYVLIVDDGTTPVSAKILALKGDPVLSNLTAVAENRLTLHETYLLPGPRLADSAELLAKTLHPSLTR